MTLLKRVYFLSLLFPVALIGAVAAPEVPVEVVLENQPTPPEQIEMAKVVCGTCAAIAAIIIIGCFIMESHTRTMCDETCRKTHHHQNGTHCTVNTRLMGFGGYEMISPRSAKEQ